MTMMGWRVMYWAFLAVGVTGVILGVALIVRAVGRRRSRILIATAAALALGGLSGTIVVQAVGPGGVGRNMMSMGGMGMMGSRTDVRAAPPASPGAPTQNVTAREFSFSPAEFRVEVGATLNVDFHNAGTISHTFTITALDFELETNGGQTASGALRVDRAGTYEFICTVAGHAQSGMRGRLIAS